MIVRNHTEQSLRFGANRIDTDSFVFSVWAPRPKKIEVTGFDPRQHVRFAKPLSPVGEGCHVSEPIRATPGALYQFVADGVSSIPDPYSRFQPHGVLGASQIVDPDEYQWEGSHWKGLNPDQLLIYECHVGAFTEQGTFQAVIDDLPRLRWLGINALELMPICEFPGRWNWGYDCVNLFAPSHRYGLPNDFKRLVDQAHCHEIGVILDVTYSHTGPGVEFLRTFANEYFSASHRTPWGPAFNFDGIGSSKVRQYIIDNAIYWCSEYRVDGFRLDATQHMVDRSNKHILTELTDVVSSNFEHPVVFIAEDSSRDYRLTESPDKGGFGLDGVWSNDFHHTMRVMLTSASGSYYEQYEGSTREIADVVNSGFLRTGKSDQKSQSGFRSPEEVRPSKFVFYLQNHDRVGNRELGVRLGQVIDKDTYAVASALVLFVPETPLLFMGQEFLASTKFHYFSDLGVGLDTSIEAARRRELEEYVLLQGTEPEVALPAPHHKETFVSSKLTIADRELNTEMQHLYRALINLRMTDRVLSNMNSQFRATAIGQSMLVVDRWIDGEHRILICNFGEENSFELASIYAVLEGSEKCSVLFSTKSVRHAYLAGQNSKREQVALRIPHNTAVVIAVTELSRRTVDKTTGFSFG